MVNKCLIDRRSFLKKSALIGAGAGFYTVSDLFAGQQFSRKKVLVLGIDGMDPHLTSIYIQKGLLPNFKKLAQKGSFGSLATSFPPQSPVAWSTFTVGASPAVHGVFDFIHRRPETMEPYLSTSRVSSPTHTLDLGEWSIPLSGGGSENLRKGIPFWDYLTAEGIPSTVFKMPGNFPCNSSDARMVSGIGTPDLRGGYGSFTLFTSQFIENSDRISGGRIIQLEFQNNQAKSTLAGPANTVKKGNPEVSIPIYFLRDRTNSVAKIDIGDHEIILQEGEWSDWIPITFPILPLISEVKGICKVYLKSVHPEFTMYVSPINIDPTDPVLPVVSSKGYGQELVDNVGYFYTQGLPEDTKALSQNILTDGEYLDLAHQIIHERSSLLQYELEQFIKKDSGFLFFYYSSLDQDTHMFWRSADKTHPLYSPALNQKFGSTLQDLYMLIDHSLGKILTEFDINDPDNCLFVMSDHGFAPFRRQVNLNSWLLESGYLGLTGSHSYSPSGYFENVDWKNTAAYNLGINSIYLNLKGREMFGAVSSAESKNLLKKIGKDLLALKDPETGENAVSNLWTNQQEINRESVPDMVVGWNRGYRNSWNSILGGISRQVFSMNTDKWSGDHCIDPLLVPGVLFANRNISKVDPALADITATLLNEFGLPVPRQMTGKPLYI